MVHACMKFIAIFITDQPTNTRACAPEGVVAEALEGAVPAVEGGAEDGLPQLPVDVLGNGDW